MQTTNINGQFTNKMKDYFEVKSLVEPYITVFFLILKIFS